MASGRGEPRGKKWPPRGVHCKPAPRVQRKQPIGDAIGCDGAEGGERAESELLGDQGLALLILNPRRKQTCNLGTLGVKNSVRREI